jgi:ribosomal protein S17E
MDYQELGNASMYDENTKHCINFMTGDTKLATNAIPGYTVVDVSTYRKFNKIVTRGD